MNYKVIYECNHYIPNVFCLIPVVIMSIGIHFLKNLKNPYLQKPKEALFFGSIFAIVGLIVTIIMILTIISNYKNIYFPYKNGKYKEVEGEVHNLYNVEFMGNGDDQFIIDGINFRVGAGTFSPGYKKNAANGGVFTKNEMKVKIRYIRYNNENYIMKIETEV